jgi:phosphate uptake regulator
MRPENPPTEASVDPEVNGLFAEMGRIAVDLGNNAKDVVQSCDPRKAAQLRHNDDAMDDLHRQLFTLLFQRRSEPKSRLITDRFGSFSRSLSRNAMPSSTAALVASRTRRTVGSSVWRHLTSVVSIRSPNQ